jgi:hypothetical protein
VTWTLAVQVEWLLFAEGGGKICEGRYNREESFCGERARRGGSGGRQRGATGNSSHKERIEHKNENDGQREAAQPDLSEARGRGGTQNNYGGMIWEQ